MADKIDAFIVTCEHGGNRIPALYRPLFQGQRRLLDSHRGYDPGALLMGATLARAFAAPLVSSTVSRLLVDLNRSIGHPRLFAPNVRALPTERRNTIIDRYYAPYRQRVEGLVAHSFARGRRVIHISSHSFTPVLDGAVRRADVGLLYDPARQGEAILCERWKHGLNETAPRLRVRRNYPYAGKGDGLTSYLRKRYSPHAYVGVELEVNQRIVFAAGLQWAALRRQIIESLLAACAVGESR